MKFEVTITKKALKEFRKGLLAFDYDPNDLKEDEAIFKEFFYFYNDFDEIDLRDVVKIRKVTD